MNNVRLGELLAIDEDHPISAFNRFAAGSDDPLDCKKSFRIHQDRYFAIDRRVFLVVPAIDKDGITQHYGVLH